MSLGKAAVYKHIPVYYPDNVGSVGGLVGMIGGLGGFVLPIAFGALNDLTGIWTSCFMLLFALVAARRVAVDACGDRPDGAWRWQSPKRCSKLPELPEMQAIHRPEHVGALAGAVLRGLAAGGSRTGMAEKGGRAIARPQPVDFLIAALLLAVRGVAWCGQGTDAAPRPWATSSCATRIDRPADLQAAPGRYTDMQMLVELVKTRHASVAGAGIQRASDVVKETAEAGNDSEVEDAGL